MLRAVTLSALMSAAAGCASTGSGRETGMESDRSIHLHSVPMSVHILCGVRTRSGHWELTARRSDTRAMEVNAAQWARQECLGDCINRLASSL
jgi:hypothetical protein